MKYILLFTLLLSLRGYSQDKEVIKYHFSSDDIVSHTQTVSISNRLDYTWLIVYIKAPERPQLRIKTMGSDTVELFLPLELHYIKVGDKLYRILGDSVLYLIPETLYKKP